MGTFVDSFVEADLYSRYFDPSVIFSLFMQILPIITTNKSFEQWGDIFADPMSQNT